MEKNETGKMSIARALKEKERIARRLLAARQLFGQCNSRSPDVKPTADAKESYEKMMDLQRRYLEIKKAIAAANADISAQLTEMLVVRAEIEYFTKLDCQEEDIREEMTYLPNGGRSPRQVRVVFNTFIKEDERRGIVEDLQGRLDDLQDQVDAYNATHTVNMSA